MIGWSRRVRATLPEPVAGWRFWRFVSPAAGSFVFVHPFGRLAARQKRRTETNMNAASVVMR